MAVSKAFQKILEVLIEKYNLPKEEVYEIAEKTFEKELV